MQQILSLATAIGFTECSPLNCDALKPAESVLGMCSADICKHYNASWSCPPACGSLSALSARMLHYRRGVLVNTVAQMQGEFDFETIAAAEALQKKRFDTLVRQARHFYPELFAMSCGTCTRCSSCTYPDRPCRYPNKLYPSMEACGLIVKDVCEASGMRYYHGKNTIAFISCILF